MAADKFDTKMMLAAQREITRLLQMQQKATPKLPSGVDFVAKDFDRRPRRRVWVWDENEDPGIIAAFGSVVNEPNLPEDSPILYLQIAWQESESKKS